MTDKEYTVDDLGNMIHDLGVELGDPESGLIVKTLKRDFFEDFKDFSVMEAFECMVDDVNRVQSLIDLHDILAEASREDLERLLKGDDDE